MIKIKRRPSSTEPVSAQPPISERKKKHFAAIVIGGTLLTINAGFINAVTLMHSGVPVTHVTGTITKAAIDAEEGLYLLFRQMIIVVSCFIFGSFLTSILVSYQTFHLGRTYNRVFFIGALFLTIGCLMGHYWPGNSHYTYFITIACGMQNAMTTSYSGSVLRTTHMTGMATDVGIVLGKLAEGNYKDAWKLKLFLPLMGGYFLGGVLGALAARLYGEVALVFNVFLFGGTGLLYTMYLAMKRHVGFFKALLSPQDLLRRTRRERRGSQTTGRTEETNGSFMSEGPVRSPSFRRQHDDESSNSSDSDEDDEVEMEAQKQSLPETIAEDADENADDDVELMQGKGSSS